MNCNDAVTALIANLEHGNAMTDEQREHIRSCERCHALLDSAKQFQTLLGENGIVTPAVDAALAKAEEEVRRRRGRRVAKTMAGTALVLILGAVAFFFRGGNDYGAREMFIIAAASLVAAGLVSIPIAIVLRVSRERFYKRLKPGRQLSGVCLGIAESTNISVGLVRLVFVFLFFFKGLGLWLYLLLDLAMPVHPDDRQYMLRFKLQRWLEKRRMAHAHDDPR
jgi:phage shock protein PspC (stress-responsive transcriptional regulator)